MTDISLQNTLKKLIELQKIDEEIYNYKTELKERPAELEELRVEFEAKKGRLHELEENAKSVLVQRKGVEIELQSKEDLIAKSNMQLSDIKTNKEYTAKLKEIEGQKADKSQLEEEILKSYDAVDKLNAEVEKEKKIVGEEEKNYLAKKNEVEIAMSQLTGQIKALDGQRVTLTPDIDTNLLARYERVLENKGGLAIVPVQGNSCGGCYMNVTAQTINQLKLSDEIVGCEMCSRILYLPEEE